MARAEDDSPLFPRETRIRVVEGRATRTHGHDKPVVQWTSLIRDHHPGYSSWEHFESNQRRLEENAHMKKTMARKAGRDGRCLLVGLLRCARCGRMLHVVYGRGDYSRHECREANRVQGAPHCIGFSARRPDETVHAAILAVVRPLGSSASLIRLGGPPPCVLAMLVVRLCTSPQ